MTRRRGYVSPDEYERRGETLDHAAQRHRRQVIDNDRTEVEA